MDLAHRSATFAWANQRVLTLCLREANPADHLSLTSVCLAVFIQHEVCGVDRVSLLDALVLAHLEVFVGRAARSTAVYRRLRFQALHLCH